MFATFWMLAEYRSRIVLHEIRKILGEKLFAKHPTGDEEEKWNRRGTFVRDTVCSTSEMSNFIIYTELHASMPGMPLQANAFCNRRLCYDWVDDLLAFSFMQNQVNRLNIDADDDCTPTATNYTLSLYLSLYAPAFYSMSMNYFWPLYTSQSQSQPSHDDTFVVRPYFFFFLQFFFRFSVLRFAHFVRFICECVCCKLCVQLLNGSGGGGNIRCGEDEKKAIEIMCAHKRR